MKINFEFPVKENVVTFSPMGSYMTILGSRCCECVSYLRRSEWNSLEKRKKWNWFIFEFRHFQTHTHTDTHTRTHKHTHTHAHTRTHTHTHTETHLRESRGLKGSFTYEFKLFWHIPVNIVTSFVGLENTKLWIRVKKGLAWLHGSQFENQVTLITLADLAPIL